VTSAVITARARAANVPSHSREPAVIPIAASQGYLPIGGECSNISTFVGEMSSLAITTISSREFNQDTSRAKQAARNGPVFITDRGRPAHVLITIEEYQKLTGGQMTLAEALAQPESADIDFEPTKIKGPLSKPVDLS